MNFIFLLKDLIFRLTNYRKVSKLAPFTSQYLGFNPYRACKEVFKGGLFGGDVYGETPLYIYEKMGRYLKKNDSFVDLGCGRGEGLLYLCSHLELKGFGIDLVKPFIEKGQRIAKEMGLDCSFQNKDLATIKLLSSDAFYIAGTCMEDEVIKHLVAELVSVKAPLIFNLSFSLEEYGLVGYKTEALNVWMPFGKTELFIHQRI